MRLHPQEVAGANSHARLIESPVLRGSIGIVWAVTMAI